MFAGVVGADCTRRCSPDRFPDAWWPRARRPAEPARRTGDRDRYRSASADAALRAARADANPARTAPRRHTCSNASLPHRTPDQARSCRSEPSLRDKGSAPFHYWPTRASDAFVGGEPVTRGGERAGPTRSSSTTPNDSPSCTSLLAVQAPTVGLHLHEFKREGEAREVFGRNGRERALAPDALIHLRRRQRPRATRVRRAGPRDDEPRAAEDESDRLRGVRRPGACWTKSYPFCPACSSSPRPRHGRSHS